MQTRTESRSVQEERKKDQEHKILSWFTLPQGLCPVLCQPAKISTKKITKISFTQYNTCKPEATTTPISKQPTEPYSSYSTNAEPTALNQLQLHTLCNM